MCLGVSLLGLSLHVTLCFLVLDDYFISHFRGIFDCYLFKYFFKPSFSFFSSRTPIMWLLVHSTLFQRSLKLSSFHFILSSLFFSMAMISTTLSSSSLVCSSASFILLIPSAVLFVCLFFTSVIVFNSLLRISYNFSICASILFLSYWIIFMIVTLNSFFSRLPISTSLCYSSGVLSCSFVCSIFLGHLILLRILFVFLWL